MSKCESSPGEPRRTPLYDTHLSLKGRMVDFGGWALPVQYEDIIEEHQTVRQAAGLFDVSHMGEIDIKGSDALELVQKLVTGDVAVLATGQILYSLMCAPSGGVVDDLLVYRRAEDRFWLVVNAANTDKDLSWVQEAAGGLHVQVTDESPQIAQIALQGPSSRAIFEKVCLGSDAEPVKNLGRYRFVENVSLLDVPCLVSRTGYTGEDGYEFYLPADRAKGFWDDLLALGEPFGLNPCGLGARDTLRFEASLPLYGHELSPDITPLEAGLERFLAWHKRDFTGKDALLNQKATGLSRKLAGIKMIGRGIARQGYPVLAQGEPIGWVTSGSLAPTLGGNYAMALIDGKWADTGSQVDVEIRGKAVAAQVVPLPFYRGINKKQ